MSDCLTVSKLTNIHGAGATDSLPAGPPEGQTGVHLVLDLDQRVQHHRPAVVQINLVILHLWFAARLLRVKSVDGERLLLLRAEAPGALLLSLGCRGRGRCSPHGEVERRAGGQREQLGSCGYCHDSKTSQVINVSLVQRSVVIATKADLFKLRLRRFWDVVTI